MADPGTLQLIPPIHTAFRGVATRLGIKPLH